MKLPMKMVPMATSNGSTTSVLLHPNWPCSGLLNTLHAYTAPSASWTSTAAMTMPHRPFVGAVLEVAMVGPPSRGLAAGLTVEPVALRYDGVLRILRRGDAGFEDAEPGGDRGRQQRRAGQCGKQPAAPAEQCAGHASRGQRPTGTQQPPGPPFAIGLAEQTEPGLHLMRAGELQGGAPDPEPPSRPGLLRQPTDH